MISKGKELTLEGLNLAWCLKQKTNYPKVCFLKLVVTLRAQSHVQDRNISNSCFSPFSKNRSTFVSSHYVLIVFISKLSLTPS